VPQLVITIQTGLREIWAHKFRSVLTMLGIVLGVSSLVAMSALTAGMEKGAKEALIAVGGLEKVRIEAQPLPPEQRYLTGLSPGITMNDVYALQQSAPLVTRLSPEMRCMATLSANGKRFRPFYCSGAWPVVLEMGEHVVQYGRMFNELDDEMARNVCVIGTGTRDRLWARLRRSARRSSRLARRSISTTSPSPSSACFSTTRARRTARPGNWPNSKPPTSPPSWSRATRASAAAAVAAAALASFSP